MTMLTLVAQVTAQPGREADLEAALRALVAPTRAEAGCRGYDLHVGTEDAALFLFSEQWETTELWERHMASPHIEAFKARTGELVADWTLHKLAKIA